MKQADKTRHGSTIAFLDFLFNLVLCFVCLVILLLVQMKQNSDPKRPENKNEFVIQVQWDDSTDDDVDVWLMDPTNKIIGYLNKEAPGMNLEKDDIGRKNKTITLPTGETQEIIINSETINITKWIPGIYHLNLHLYRPDFKRMEDSPEEAIHVTVKIIKINPYSEVLTKNVLLKRVRPSGEVTVANIKISEDGVIEKITSNQTGFVLETVRTLTNPSLFNAPNLQTP